jgi:hypothetical protein
MSRVWRSRQQHGNCKVAFFARFLLVSTTKPLDFGNQSRGVHSIMALVLLTASACLGSLFSDGTLVSVVRTSGTAHPIKFELVPRKAFSASEGWLHGESAYGKQVIILV